MSGTALTTRLKTRVRTAVAWLERAGFLERNENNTKVFQGKPLVRNQNHPVRNAIKGLITGHNLQLELRNGHLELVDSQGVSVARLSTQAKAKWEAQHKDVQEARVLAIVRRYITGIQDDQFRQSCEGDAWELTIVELVT